MLRTRRWQIGYPLIAALFVGIPLAAQTESRNHDRGTVREHVIEAPSLAANLIGDEARKRVLVYLPPGYSQNELRYPTLYLLHGIFDSPDTWTNWFNVPQYLDSAIVAGTLPPVIVVMPSGQNRLGGGYYRDSPVSGQWSRFVAEELVAWVDAEFRTLPHRNSRGLTGHSMGGYGAIHLAMEHPDVFGTVYAMSPCCLAAVDDLGQGNPMWQTVLGFSEWEDLDRVIASQSISGLYAAALLGISMAWATDTATAPFHTEFPFQVRRGETTVNDPRYSTWSDAFPVHLVDARVDALRSLNGLALDYGIDEQFAHIPTGARMFAERLSAHRVPFALDVYRGDHRNRVQERFTTIVLPFLLERVQRDAREANE